LRFPSILPFIPSINSSLPTDSNRFCPVSLPERSAILILQRFLNPASVIVAKKFIVGGTTKIQQSFMTNKTIPFSRGKNFAMAAECPYRRTLNNSDPNDLRDILRNAVDDC